MSGLSEQLSSQALLFSLVCLWSHVGLNGSCHLPTLCLYPNASHLCSLANLKKHQSLSDLSPSSCQPYPGTA